MPNPSRRTLFLILLGEGLCMLMVAVAGLSAMHHDPPLAPVVLEVLGFAGLAAALGLGWVGWRKLADPGSRN